MKAGIILSWLLFPVFTGMAYAGDMRMPDFLKRHGQQLAHFQGDSPRQSQIARMLSRKLLSIVKGGDINARDSRGQTALMMAAALNNRELVDGLLLYGADPGIATPKGRCAHHLCTDVELRRKLISCCLKAAQPASLHDAVQLPEKAFEKTLKLLRAGADINQLNDEGKTPLMLLTAEQTELAHLLLEAGANPAHWCMKERAKAKVRKVEVLFTHKSLTPEELEAEDAENARTLDRMRAEKVKWMRFIDAAMVRAKPRNGPSSFKWDWREKRHINNNLVYKMNEARGIESPGRSGYIGPVYRGKVTLHYDQEGVPPLSVPVQSGGRAHNYFGNEERTSPSIPEGMAARIYPDFHGYSINGFYISCLGRDAIPKFTEDRNSILLHLALVAVPGETEETTIRSSGSHGCISMKNLSDWKIIYHELRGKGHTPSSGIELTITYAVK